MENLTLDELIDFYEKLSDYINSLESLKVSEEDV